MKLTNQYNTPMGEMRHEVAQSKKANVIYEADYPNPPRLVWVGTPAVLEEKEKVHTIAPDPIIEEKDYKAFAVGLGVLLAIAVFSLYLLL